MQVTAFDTANAPEPLTAFRAAAHEFQVDPIGDPAAFFQRWRMLKLGDLNVIHAVGSPVRYQRDLSRILADGEDWITIHNYIAGGSTGLIDGREVSAGVGDAMIWDLARPLDMQSAASGGHELLIVTLPRMLVDEVMPTPSLAGPIPASPELALAVSQARNLIDEAASVPDAAAVFLSRGLRDMFAVAMMPVFDSARPTAPNAPLLQSLTNHLDAHLSDEPEVDATAAALGVAPQAVTEIADHFGGLPLLAERRRLLAAYRLLCDQGETATVEVIAHRCGFNNLTRFSRRFSSVFRTSARDLRRYGRGHLPEWAGAYHVEKLYGAMISGNGVVRLTGG